MPASKSATASSGSSTRPSSAAPPISAPRSGPEARSQRDRRAGVQELAALEAEHARTPGATSTSIAWTSSIAASACSLASRRSGSAATVARSASVPGIGGRQSTRVTATAWAATASASRSAPTLTTWRGCGGHAGASEQLDRAAGGGGVGQVDLGAGLGERPHLPVEVLRVVGGADDGDDHRLARPAGERRRERGRPGPARRRGRAPRRAGSPRCAGRPRPGPGARAAASGRSSGARGRRCSASSPKSTIVCASAVRSGPSASSG